MMKKLLTALFVLIVLDCSAQDNRDTVKGYDPTNLFVGGSINLSLGGYSNSFLIGVNPFIGYTFKKWIDAGVVINYQHYSEKDQYSNKYRSNTVGAGVFTRLYPVQFIFIQVQPEYNFITQRYLQNNVPGLRASFNAPSLLLGAGYTSSRRDKNTFTYFSLMIDVLKNKNSPYIDADGDIIPVVRAGMNVGLGKR